MDSIREAMARWIYGLIKSRHIRFWTSLVLWLQMTIMLLGRGLRGLFSNGMGNPYSSTIEQYRRIHWTPQGGVYVPDTVTYHGSVSVGFWHWMWGVWVFLTTMLLVQLLVEFAEEVGRGWVSAHRAITERENVESAAPSPTPAESGGSLPPNKPGFRLTPINFLELEVMGEFAGEALYRFWRKISGSKTAAGGAKP